MEQVPVAFTMSGNTVVLTDAQDGRYHYFARYQWTKTVAFVRVKKHLGTPGEPADATLMAEVPSKWFSTSKLSGYTYTYIRLNLNRQEFMGGIPAVEVLVKGKKLLDPRTGLTVWSANPALATYDYLRSPICGIPLADIPTADVITAANACDELVLISGTMQARYTCNGTVSSDKDQEKTLDQLTQAMAGGLNQTTLQMWAGKYVAPTFTLEQSDIVGEVSVTPGLSDSDIFNGVTARFIGPENNYVPTDIKPYQNATYLAADGRDLFASMEFPFTDTTQRCHNLARIFVEDNRNSITVKGVFSAKAWDRNIGDRVYLNTAFFGYTAKVFRIVGKSYGATATVSLTLKEDAASIWDLADAVTLTESPGSNLPNPFAITAPGAPTITEDIVKVPGIAGSMVRVKVAWSENPSVRVTGYVVQYKLYSATTWETLPATGELYRYIMDLAPNKYDFRVQAINVYFSIESAFGPITTYTVVGKTAPPSDVASITSTIEKLGTRLRWSAVPDIDLLGYELRTGGSDWTTAAFLAFVAEPATEYFWKAQSTTGIVVRIKAIDTNKPQQNYSVNAASVTVTIAPPSAPSVSWTLSGPDEIITWTEPASGFAIDWYDVRYGASWAAGVSVGTTKATFLRRKVDYFGARTYWVNGIDIATNVGTAGGLASNVNYPNTVTGLRADVVDHTALLYWTANSIGTGQLPIEKYEVRKGATWAGGTVVGSNGNSTFASTMEQAGGVYTYWCAAIDTAGNTSTPAQLQITLNQPPDYILRNNYDVPLSSITWVNFDALPSGTHLGPHNTTKTFTQHYSGAGWATPQAKIDAGYPIYAQPGLASGSGEIVIDYGTTIPSTIVSSTVNAAALAGSVSQSVTMSWKLNLGDAWTVLTAGSTSELIPQNFRYVRWHNDFSCTAGVNLLAIYGVNIKLATKTRTDGGSATTSASLTTESGVSAYWTTVTFSYPFLYADCPSVQSNSTTALIPLIVYAGGANPTTFKVAFVNTSGVNVASVPFSWTVKGN